MYVLFADLKCLICRLNVWISYLPIKHFFGLSGYNFKTGTHEKWQVSHTKGRAEPKKALMRY
jgi:hypothetical protein